jgi:hypothetical protein
MNENANGVKKSTSGASPQPCGNWPLDWAILVTRISNAAHDLWRKARDHEKGDGSAEAMIRACDRRSKEIMRCLERMFVALEKLAAAVPPPDDEGFCEWATWDAAMLASAEEYSAALAAEMTVVRTAAT